MSYIKPDYTSGNNDDIHAAIDALNTFTHMWCMNCEETDKSDDLIFRCSECEFSEKDTKNCKIKLFCLNHDEEYTRAVDFGCMGLRF